jgi:hypothetical protein
MSTKIRGRHYEICAHKKEICIHLIPFPFPLAEILHFYCT